MADFSGLAAQVAAEMTSQGVAPQAHVQAIGNQGPPAPAPAPAPFPAAAAPANTPSPVPTHEPTAQPPEPAAPGLEVPTPIAWQYPDDALIDLGNGQIVAARDLKGGGLRQADYSRKTQEIAAVRDKATKAEEYAAKVQTYEAERAQIEQFLENPTALVQYALKSWGPQQVVQQLQSMTGMSFGQAQATVQQAAAAPDQIGQTPAHQPDMATVQDLQMTIQYLQQQHAQQQQTFQQEAAAQTQVEIQAALQRVEDQKSVAEYERALDFHINQLVASDPFLQATPYVDQVFKFEVLQRQPQTFEELQSILRSTAQAQVVKYHQAAQHALKLQTVQQVQQRAQSGIEPPGGTAPQPTAANFFKADGAADWKGLGQAATAFIQNYSRS